MPYRSPRQPRSFPVDRLPVVTSDIPRDLRLFIDRLRVVLQNGTFVTTEALANGPLTIYTDPNAPPTGQQETDPNSGCVIQLPPTPTGLVASGGYGIIYVEWDMPLYCGHAYTEVWRAQKLLPEDPDPTFESASAAGITPGSRWIDTVGSSETWYYWIRHVNINGIEGAISALAFATSAVDVEYLLNLLAGEISESQLTAALNTRIEVIEGDITALEVTVNDPTDGVVATAAALDQVELQINDTDTGLVATATRVSQLVAAIKTDDLLSDGDFVLTAEDGVLGVWWSNEASASILPADGPDGAPALKILTASARVDVAAMDLSARSWIPAVAGTTLYVSFWYFASTDYDSDESGFSVGVDVLDIDLVDLASPIELHEDGASFATGVWKQVTGTLDVTAAGAAYVGPRCTVLDSSTTGYVLFAGFHVSRYPASFVAIEQASRITGLEAQYTVKIDVNGFVTGFGLAVTSPDGVPTSEFAIVADRFSVAPPIGYETTDPIYPLVFQASPTTINGVSVPVGLYVDGAYIMNGTIANAQIGNAVVTDAKIASCSVGKLTAGTLAVDSYARSTGFISGSAGWNIAGSGNAEFNNCVVRGGVYASYGEFAGYLKADSGWFRGYVSTGNFGSGYTWPASGGTGTYLSYQGLLIGNQNDGKWFQVNADGNLYAPQFSIVNGVAKFNGSVNVGSFSSCAWPSAGLTGAHLSSCGLLIGNFNGGKYFQVDSGAGNPNNAYISTNIPFVNTININDAQITTLKVAGNAITAPAAAWCASQLCTSEYTQILYIGLTTVGSPCFCFGNVCLDPGSAAGGNVAVELVRDSTTVLYSTGWFNLWERTVIPLSIINTPAAGWHSFSVRIHIQFDIWNPTFPTAYNSALSMLEVRR